MVQILKNSRELAIIQSVSFLAILLGDTKTYCFVLWQAGGVSVYSSFSTTTPRQQPPIRQPDLYTEAFATVISTEAVDSHLLSLLGIKLLGADWEGGTARPRTGVFWERWRWQEACRVGDGESTTRAAPFLAVAPRADLPGVSQASRTD